eukprot:m.619087 g.619087  ORF g.619087 m.619087 type:complete len:86 (+) comp58194_c1_seq10:1419-1676(+)
MRRKEASRNPPPTASLVPTVSLLTASLLPLVNPLPTVNLLPSVNLLPLANHTRLRAQIPAKALSSELSQFVDLVIGFCGRFVKLV